MICDTIKTIVKLYNEDFKYYKNFKVVNPDDVNTWDFEECSCASKHHIDTYFNTLRFFQKMDFMPEAFQALRELSKKNNLCIVSHGYEPNLKLKEKWVQNILPPGTEFIGVNLKEHVDKSCVDMSGGIFIDDSLINIVSSNASYKILFGKDYPWNADSNEKKDYFRCYDWKETLNVINGIENGGII